MNKSASISQNAKRRVSNTRRDRQPLTEMLEGRTLMSDVVGAGGIITDNSSSSSPLLRCNLVVLSQPTVNPASGTFSLTIGVENSSGNLVPNDSITGQALPAEIAIASGPAGAALSGAMLATVNSDGTMTFSGVAVSLPGAYSFNVYDATPLASTITASVNLDASSAVTSSAPSDRVQTVTDAAGQIVILNQPQFNSSDGTFTLAVQLQDANGNPIASSAANPVGEAKIEIASGPADSFAALYGDSSDDTWNGKTGEAVVNPDGTATFSGLKVSTAGTYTFKISDATPSASVITASVNLSPPPVGPINTGDPVPIVFQPNPISPIFVAPIITQTPPGTANQGSAAAPVTASPTLTPKQLRAELKAEKIAEAKQLKAAKRAAARELKIQRLEKLAVLRAARKAAAKAAKKSSAVTDVTVTPLG